MKNTKYNHLLSKADRVEPNNTWYMSISLKNSKTVTITEDNIEHYLGIRLDGLLDNIFRNVYNKYKIADWTAKQFENAIMCIAASKNLGISWQYLDNDRIEQEEKRFQ